LDSKVLVVAKEGAVRDWAAYIGAVPGEDHELEWHLVLRDGSKLPREVAEILFPRFCDLTWRD
jgi:hypothetical protein